ncbi:MAG: hypothetical protein JO157_11515 [Acetobacteraceae bacterium]|nr:hypothetical protein [Acetobacteraceae bacterium]
MRFPPTALVPAILLPAALALAAEVVTVSQHGRAFLMRDVHIARGDTVHFTNDDDFTHQIYVSSPSFSYESAEQPPGEAVDVRFPSAGLFEVRCHIHPKMLLHVDVR